MKRKRTISLSPRELEILLRENAEAHIGTQLVDSDIIDSNLPNPLYSEGAIGKSNGVGLQPVAEVSLSMMVDSVNSRFEEKQMQQKRDR